MAQKEPVSGISHILHRIRSGDLQWLANRFGREWILPTTNIGRLLYYIRHPLRVFRRSNYVHSYTQQDCLFAFYDLAVAPVTFDFLWFLAAADLERRLAGLATIYIIIVPGIDDGLRRERADYEAIVNSSARRARIVNIILPACGFLPALSGITIASSRDAAAELTQRAGKRAFPKEYEPKLPSYPGPKASLEAGRRGEQVAILRATPNDIEVARSWLKKRCGKRQLITITLRQYGYMTARNSNVNAWATFAERLDTSRFFPVFIPDTDQAFEEIPEPLSRFSLCSEAAWNLGLRFGLYEMAYVNLGVNNGPMGLCWLDEKTNYITFKMLSESVPQATTEYMRQLGFDIGRSLPFATPSQKWVWEDDTIEVIEREFNAFVQYMDANDTESAQKNSFSA